MTKIKLEKEFLEIFPDGSIYVIKAKNLNNKIIEENKYKHLIENAQEVTIANNLTQEVFTDNEVIRVWRDAYQKFKTKKGARVSIENLLKRVKNGNPVGSINPIVDLYNYISIKYAFPIGGDDHSKTKGDISFALAKGGEDFYAIGSDKNEPALEGEVIFKDEQGPICRCWNWRQEQRTMITEETTEALFVIEYCDSTRVEEQIEAGEELAKLLELELGATTESFLLNKDNSIKKM